jgi:glycosyltransferase involved in cell wall biosynthesis
MAERVRPVHVLHVLGSLNRGGVETWLIHVLEHMDQRRFRSDVMVHTEAPSVLDDAAIATGAKVLPCPLRPNLIQYARAFRRVLKANGPYDVVHSHVHHFSGITLLIARLSGVPIRVAHSHSDTSALDRSASLWRRAYLAITQVLVNRNSTIRVGVTPETGVALYGESWTHRSTDHELLYGIDLSPFDCELDRAAVREELGLPLESFVVGHVGRFCEVKNHRFLIEVFAALKRSVPEAKLLLVGSGDLRAEIEARVRSLGLESSVIFAGLRSDVPRIVRGAIDVLVMPSLYEGFPIVTIECQAAGVPLLMSDRIANKTDVVPGLTSHLSLAAPVEAWVSEIKRLRCVGESTDRRAALRILQGTNLNIDRSILELQEIYSGR